MLIRLSGLGAYALIAVAAWTLCQGCADQEPQRGDASARRGGCTATYCEPVPGCEDVYIAHQGTQLLIQDDGLLVVAAETYIGVTCTDVLDYRLDPAAVYVSGYNAYTGPTGPAERADGTVEIADGVFVGAVERLRVTRL